MKKDLSVFYCVIAVGLLYAILERMTPGSGGGSESGSGGDSRSSDAGPYADTFGLAADESQRDAELHRIFVSHESAQVLCLRYRLLRRRTPMSVRCFVRSDGHLLSSPNEIALAIRQHGQTRCQKFVSWLKMRCTQRAQPRSASHARPPSGNTQTRTRSRS